jgi:hypothetical protein
MRPHCLALPLPCPIALFIAFLFMRPHCLLGALSGHRYAVRVDEAPGSKVWSVFGPMLPQTRISHRPYSLSGN